MSLLDQKHAFYNHLYANGTSARQWSESKKFPYDLVVSLLNGRNKGLRGTSLKIRQAIEQELTQAV